MEATARRTRRRVAPKSRIARNETPHAAAGAIDALPLERELEWLEADGLGGYACGTAAGLRTRRYHALRVAAVKGPAARAALVNGFDAWLITPAGRFPLSAQVYEGGIESPGGAAHLAGFAARPWPTWTFRIPGGIEIRQEIFVPRGIGATVLRWTITGAPPACRLEVRPFVSGRDQHALQIENAELRFDAAASAGRVALRPYAAMPEIVLLHDGAWRADPHWYRAFHYAEEAARGYPAREDLAAPGVLELDLSHGAATCILAAAGEEPALLASGDGAAAIATSLAERERARRGAGTAADLAADAYLVARGAGRTLIAGYPWFADWGRDAMIALRGLLIARGRLDEARDVLRTWADAAAGGMIPNRFADDGESVEDNAVDASLWFVVAVNEYFAARRSRGQRVAPAERAALRAAADGILESYARGARHGISADEDGLLWSGAPGLQLTWMDARIGDEVVTPRAGKAVEVQALWLNALRIGGSWSARWRAAWRRGMSSFAERFAWPEEGGLFDVVDVDRVPGAVDRSFRPNQIYAVGGLPWPLLRGERARRLVDEVESRLWTPAGPRSLEARDPRYRARYEGGVESRDRAYHQGTAWPFLAGAFVEAWVRVRGSTPAAKAAARARFLDPLLRRLDPLGLGHLPEIADGDAPHAPRGCPFQAWSLGEVLRLDRAVLHPETPTP